jgi:hypothetical protein
MTTYTTITANFGDQFVRLARLVRTATRADFVAEFGDIVTAREERAIAAGDYVVVRKMVHGREGAAKTIHRTALGTCARCLGSGRIHSSCDPYGIAPCPACRPSNPKEGA